MDTPNGAVGIGPVARSPGATAALARRSPGLDAAAVGRGELAACLRLTLGRPVDIEADAWSAVLNRAIAERCAAVAWQRSEAWIRAKAPVSVLLTWESWVTTHRKRLERQLDNVVETLAWLTAHGLTPIVLKGTPLGVTLYGSEWARPVMDLDLFLPEAQTAAACAALTAAGWRKRAGDPPNDIEFIKIDGADIWMLELHSSLAGPWLRGRPFPEPQFADVTVGGRRVRSSTGDFLPGYLASHLLQHGERPLLWLVDFATLWQQLNDAGRTAARAAARAARVGRALEMVEAWIQQLDRLADGAESDTRVQRDILCPGSPRAVVQLMRSSDTVLDSARIVRQLLGPADARSPAALVRLWVARVVRVLRPSRDHHAPGQH